MHRSFLPYGYNLSHTRRFAIGATDRRCPGPGHKTGSKVKHTAGPSAVGGLTNGSTYFVITSGANTLKLATTLANALAGTAIDLTSRGAGTQTLTPVLVTRFSSSHYRNTNAGDGNFLESTGRSVVDDGVG